MTALYAIFCADPLDPRAIEPEFATEAGPARDAGFTPVRLDHDELDRRIDPAEALRRTRLTEPGKAVYRGWMLSEAAYRGLFDALAARGVDLLTTPAQYAACHHAPGSYAQLAEWMPKTVWVDLAELDDPAAIGAALAGFGSAPVIVKDWVKSQASGYWSEACYIADASDTQAADRVIARFRELQGESLTGGLVFKAYVPLLPVGSPAHEYRGFAVKGRAIGCWPRSEQAREFGAPPGELLDRIAAAIPSPFASMDFGLDGDGRWWLLEIGDGQVSGLPAPEAAHAIFAALADD